MFCHDRYGWPVMREQKVCSQCDESLGSKDRFCKKCGAHISDDSETNSAVGKTCLSFRPWFLKLGVTRRILIFSGASLCLVALVAAFALAYAARTEKVQVTVQVDAPYGGLFIGYTSCAPRSNRYAMLTSKTLSFYANGRELSAELPLVWRRVSDTTCEARVAAELSPGQEWQVKANGQTFGAVTRSDFDIGSLTLKKQVKVTRSLTGTIKFVQFADSCKGSSKTAWECSWSPNYQVSMTIDPKTGGCAGAGGYGDLKAGMPVKILGSAGNILSETRVLTASVELTSKSSAQITCKLFWSASEVPNDDKGYSIAAGRRGEVYFDSRQLVADSWTADTSIGD